MATSKQTIKESKHRKPNESRFISLSEMHLNEAFDGLNRCKIRTQSVPSELGTIIIEALNSAIQVYNQAHHLYQIGQHQSSIRSAKSVSQLCNLLNDLAEEQTENILKLPLPPSMHLITSKKEPRPRKLHPSLNMLDSLIRRRMMHSSKFYKSRLKDSPEILSQFSKHLAQMERYH